MHLCGSLEERSDWELRLLWERLFAPYWVHTLYSMPGANHFQDIILIDPLCDMILRSYKNHYRVARLAYFLQIFHLHELASELYNPKVFSDRIHHLKKWKKEGVDHFPLWAYWSQTNNKRKVAVDVVVMVTYTTAFTHNDIYVSMGPILGAASSTYKNTHTSCINTHIHRKKLNDQ